MSHKSRSCLYDKNIIVPIYDKNGEVEERKLNMCVINMEDVLQIKIRDPQEYCFNYTENINLADFEIIRMNQSLDIDFNGFKCNLIEMLEQFQKKEMFLKCEKCNEKCTLVFYGKSKIKSIVYLTVDLHVTNQKEIISELIGTLQQIKNNNDNLKRHLTNARKLDSEKEQEINLLIMQKGQMETQFYNGLKQLDNFFNVKIKEVEKLLQNKITFHQQRIGKLLEEVHLLKRDAGQKYDSSARLIKSIENLRLETVDNAAIISQLKKENSALLGSKLCQEKKIAELNRVLEEKEAIVVEMQKNNDELRSDIEKAALAITQKKATIDELSKDLVQANHVLVNFNNHYDNKAKQVEELQAALITKDKIIKEQRLRTNELLSEFEDYKEKFNREIQEKLKHEIFLANSKIEELEKSIRKVNKINMLLTEKVNQNQIFNNK